MKSKPNQINVNWNKISQRKQNIKNVNVKTAN